MYSPEEVKKRRVAAKKTQQKGSKRKTIKRVKVLKSGAA